MDEHDNKYLSKINTAEVHYTFKTQNLKTYKRFISQIRLRIKNKIKCIKKYLINKIVGQYFYFIQSQYKFLKLFIYN